MVPAPQRALQAREHVLVAALLAYLASYVHEPTVEVAAVFGIMAVVAFAAASIFDADGRAAGAWIAPTLAAAVTLGTTTTADQRLGALAVAGITVFASFAYPLTKSTTSLSDGAENDRRQRDSADQR